MIVTCIKLALFQLACCPSWQTRIKPSTGVD